MQRTNNRYTPGGSTPAPRHLPLQHCIDKAGSIPPCTQTLPDIADKPLARALLPPAYGGVRAWFFVVTCHHHVGLVSCVKKLLQFFRQNFLHRHVPDGKDRDIAHPRSITECCEYHDLTWPKACRHSHRRCRQVSWLMTVSAILLAMLPVAAGADNGL